MAISRNKYLSFGLMLSLLLIGGGITWIRAYSVPAYQARVHEAWAYDTHGNIVRPSADTLPQSCNSNYGDACIR